MKRSTRRSKRIKKQNLKGIILIMFVSLVVISAFVIYGLNKQNSIALDKNTFCPIDKISSITAILIDETDSLSPIQQKSLRNELLKIRNEIPLHGKLEIYLIGNTKKGILQPILSMCNPGRGKDANRFNQNPKLVERKWKSAFEAPLENVLYSLSNVEISKESPIMESIQSISVTSFNNPENQNARQRRLIIASDMLQFTHEFNLYNANKIPHNTWQSGYLKKMHADLRDVKIDILIFRRDTANNIQGHQLINFWDEFLANQGATIQRIYAITG